MGLLGAIGAAAVAPFKVKAEAGHIGPTEFWGENKYEPRGDLIGDVARSLWLRDQTGTLRILDVDVAINMDEINVIAVLCQERTDGVCHISRLHPRGDRLAVKVRKKIPTGGRVTAVFRADPLCWDDEQFVDVEEFYCSQMALYDAATGLVFIVVEVQATVGPNLPVRIQWNPVGIVVVGV
jgi:hypothetical protein